MILLGFEERAARDREAAQIVVGHAPAASRMSAGASLLRETEDGVHVDAGRRCTRRTH